jgi:hypothetical protein
VRRSPSSIAHLLLVYAGTVAVLAAIGSWSAAHGLPPYLLTRDPAAIHGTSAFLGALSNLGVLLWAAAASVMLFTAGLLGSQGRAGEARGFLAQAGVFTAWLLLDDLFMLHERSLPDRFGVPQPLLLAVYGGLVILLLARHRGLIARTDYRPLALACGFFACSATLDQGPGDWHEWTSLVLVEDGAKLLGIVSWLVYFAATARAAALGRLSDPVSSLAGWPFRSRTPAGAVTSRDGSPTRAERGSSLGDATRATPGNPPAVPPRTRTAD